MASQPNENLDKENPVVEAIKKTLLCDIAELKSIGEERKWKVRPLYATKSKDNYASILYVAERTDVKTGETTSLVVKVMHEDLFVRTFQNSDKQFYNEGNMLQNVIPLLMKYSGLRDVISNEFSLFPKCYHADDDPEKAIIVMENLQVQGYVLADLNLDYLHCKMSLEGLARFHALSYSLKHKHGAIFQTRVVDTLKEARFCDQNRGRQNVYMGYTSMHPVNFILKSNDQELVEFRNKNQRFLDKLCVVFENTVDHLERLNLPKEPLAVLCHGDYNRNNIMFSYENGKPALVKMLDFQTVRYANPSTDIAFLLYMNTTIELRSQHLDDLLSTYQKTLVSSLVEMTQLSRDELDQIYSIDTIRADFERHALLGYVISAMFIHFMLATVEELIEMHSTKEFEADDDVPSEEYLKKAVQLGGAEATQRSVAIIKEMALMKHCFDY